MACGEEKTKARYAERFPFLTRGKKYADKDFLTALTVEHVHHE
jgi:hypothetical protein